MLTRNPLNLSRDLLTFWQTSLPSLIRFCLPRRGTSIQQQTEIVPMKEAAIAKVLTNQQIKPVI